MTSTQGGDNNYELINHRLTTVEAAIVEFAESQGSIAKSLETLIKLEVRYDNQDRILAEIASVIKTNDLRIKAIEAKTDFWDRSSKAVWAGLIGAVVLIGGFVWQASVTINEQRTALTEYREFMLEQTAKK